LDFLGPDEQGQLMTTQAPSPPKPTTAAFDWAAARGEKWQTHLTGMESMLAPIDAPLIDALQLDRPYRIADLGCGGGGTTLELLRRAPAGSVVHGFDISPALIESARARTLPERPEIAFSLADVATGSPPGEPYERLLSRFGVMFYDDPPAAFANLNGWIKPGGRIAFAVWGSPADNPLTSLLREVAAEFMDLPAPDPDLPGPFRYAKPEKLLTLLDAAGFTRLEVNDWRGELPVGGGLAAAEAAAFALESFSIGEWVAEAGEAAHDNVRKSLVQRYARHEAAGTVRLGVCVKIVTGERARAD
jgi:SAM-dependent methyltransferase